MKHVYIVMSGEYETYDVGAIFTTREAAEAHATEQATEDDSGSAVVQKWELDNPDAYHSSEQWVVEVKRPARAQPPQPSLPPIRIPGYLVLYSQ